MEVRIDQGLGRGSMRRESHAPQGFNNSGGATSEGFTSEVLPTLACLSKPCAHGGNVGPRQVSTATPGDMARTRQALSPMEGIDQTDGSGIELTTSPATPSSAGAPSKP